jgi:hypothetical protein
MFLADLVVLYGVVGGRTSGITSPSECSAFAIEPKRPKAAMNLTMLVEFIASE